MKSKLHSVTKLGKEFAIGMTKRRLTVYATSGCYYLFMAQVPLVMITCCILPYTPYNLATILKYIDMYFAKSLADVMRNIAGGIYSSNSGTLTVSILLALFSASASMRALMRGMNSAYECDIQDNFILFTLKAFLNMFLLVGTILISLIIMVYGRNILRLLQRHLIHVGVLDSLLSGSRYIVVMLILTVVFTMVYTIMPARRTPLLQQLPGAIFAAITWVIFSWGFSLYIKISDQFGAYGVIGTIMVAMLWMHYCLFFLLIGGYMNCFLSTDWKNQESEIDLADTPEVYDQPDTIIKTEETKPTSSPLIKIIAASIICAIAAFGTVFMVHMKRSNKSSPARKSSTGAKLLQHFFQSIDKKSKTT